MLLDCIINIVKIIIPSSAIPIRLTMVCFTELEQQQKFRFVWKQNILNSQRNLEKEKLSCTNQIS